MTLQHPKMTLYFGGGFCAIFSVFLVFAALSNAYPSKQNKWVVVSVAATFVALCVPALLTYYRNRHEVTSAGMVFGSTFGRGGRFEWHEVTKVQYDSMRKRLRIEARGGKVAIVPIMLQGVPQFARIVQLSVPEDLLDAKAKTALKWLVNGNVPPPL